MKHLRRQLIDRLHEDTQAIEDFRLQGDYVSIAQAIADDTVPGVYTIKQLTRDVAYPACDDVMALLPVWLSLDSRWQRAGNGWQRLTHYEIQAIRRARLVERYYLLTTDPDKLSGQ